MNDRLAPEPTDNSDGGVPGGLGETVLDEIVGQGARLCVTPTRVAIVRDGSERRPRSGIRTWPLGFVHVRLEPPRQGTGRLILSDSPAATNSVSLFVPVAHWPAAERAVGRIRSMARNVRRPRRAAAPDAAAPQDRG
jgi:hypothetical protein